MTKIKNSSTYGVILKKPRTVFHYYIDNEEVTRLMFISELKSYYGDIVYARAPSNNIILYDARVYRRTLARLKRGKREGVFKITKERKA